MRIISFCADNLKEAEQNGFFDWALQQDADFICVQNLACKESEISDEIYYLKGYNAYFFDAINPAMGGVAIFCKPLPKAIMTGLGFLDFDNEGRYIQADFEGYSVGCLLAPYASADDSNSILRKAEFFELLESHLAKISNKRRDFIFCGNLQMAHTGNDIQDITNNIDQPGFKPAEQLWLENLFSSTIFTDAFRHINHDNDEFTWWPEGQRGQNGWRVDYQIASEGFKNTIEYGFIYKNQIFGKHAPLVIDYDFDIEYETY